LLESAICVGPSDSYYLNFALKDFNDWFEGIFALSRFGWEFNVYDFPRIDVFIATIYNYAHPS